MKRTILMTGILLMLLLAGNTSLYAQQNMRTQRDTTRLNRPGREMRHENMNGDMQGNMQAFDRGMRYGMWAEEFNHRWMGPYGRRNGFHEKEYDRWGIGPYGMRNGIPGGRFDRMRPEGPGLMRIESIVKLTDKQKQEIENLRQKQVEEMKKVRNEISEKLRVMREDNRKAVLGLLTDEQKKQLEQAR